MNKIKRIKDSNYTTISNVFLRDERLSLKAKGFLTVVMALPEDWDFSIKGICSILKEGTSAIYSTIDELKEFGYCHVETSRNANGSFSGSDYTFYEEPHAETPHTENPHTGNRAQINKELTKDLFEQENNNITCQTVVVDETADFIERMYNLYPTKCPLRDKTLGKTYKDKDRLRKLLKTYSMDEIERVITFEVEEKYGKSWMSNFSTFLNNFPDPNCIDVTEKADNNADIVVDETRLNFNGQIYR